MRVIRLFIRNKFYTSLFISLIFSFHLSGNPTDGTVVGGNATISSSGSTLTVNQTTDRAVINWNSFSIANGETTKFVQPSVTSAILNRVTGANLSEIYGTLSSNGQVYLMNPNGILIGSSGVINTQGGFVASTHDIANNSFMTGGDLIFSGNSAAAIVNLGKIGVDNGDVYLIARQVTNRGTIAATNGEIGLAGGTQILLKASGSGKISILPSSASGTIENSDKGTIQAASASLLAVGGNEYALAINNGGTIRANGVEKIDGKVILFATDGKTKNTGIITASNADGKGGFIETSGKEVEIKGSILTGEGGEWLIDPLTVDSNSIAIATLQSQLNSGHVTETATSSITLDEDLSWTGSGVLTLTSTGGSIALNGAISASSGGLTLNGGTISATSPISVHDFILGSGTWTQNAATLPSFYAYNFVLSGGTFLRVLGGTGTSADPYLLTDVYGLQGIATTSLLSKSFKLANDIDASGTSAWNSGKGFKPIGTSSSSYYGGIFDGNSHVISGLTINDNTNNYVGLFGYVQNASFTNLGLTNVSITGGHNTGGLFGYENATSGTLNINHVYVTGSVTGGGSGANTQVGGLFGYILSNSSATVNIADCYTNGSVLANPTGATASTGGLGGYIYSGSASASTINITNCHSDSTVDISTTYSIYTGGLIGQAEFLYGSINISNSYATGNVTAASAAGGNYLYTGGLIGYVYGLYAGTPKITISNSYATGNVKGNGGSGASNIYTGGLIGYIYSYYSSGNNVVIDSSYATGTVYGKGGAYVESGGLIGTLYLDRNSSNTMTLNNSYASGSVTAEGTGICTFAGGLIGYANVGNRNGSDVNGLSTTNCYATGNVSGSNSGANYVYVGGLIGYTYINGRYGYGSMLLDNCYATGSASGSGADYVFVGGLVGYNGTAWNTNPTMYISDCYATGAVSKTTSGANSYAGGLIGFNDNASGKNYITRCYFDATTTGVANSIGYDSTSAGAVSTSSGAYSSNSKISDISSVSSSGTAYQHASYGYLGTWTETASGSGVWVCNDGSANTYIMIEGATRPFLYTEYSTSISNAHSLQLMAYSPSASYSLTKNIAQSTSEIGGSGVWASTGFSSVGNANVAFTGSFSGGNRTIDKLYINNSGSTYAGLFGYMTDATVSQIGLTNVSITGGSYAGGIAGYSGGASTISGSYVTGSVSGTTADGLVASNSGTISSSYSQCYVNGVWVDTSSNLQSGSESMELSSSTSNLVSALSASLLSSSSLSSSTSSTSLVGTSSTLTSSPSISGTSFSFVSESGTGNTSSSLMTGGSSSSSGEYITSSSTASVDTTSSAE